MGLQQSKDELLYQQVNYGNIEGIKALRSDGAGLEWIDKEGKTPLILACMNPELHNVAKTLIELGANVNAYRPGRHAGTPLHHAAKRGLERTVKLLLSHGANALVMNDDCQTPLDVARSKGCGNVVRAIEGHICLFSGLLREFYGPGFLELLSSKLQLVRTVWVVVLPCGSRNLSKPLKLELAIYTGALDAQPRTIIALWKAHMEEPKFNQADPTVVISDISNKSRIKLAPANENEKEQLKWFCNACKGIPQVMSPSFAFITQGPPVPGTAPPAAEDLELAMAINASLKPTALGHQPGPTAHASTSSTNPTDIANHNGWGTPPPHKGSSINHNASTSSTNPTDIANHNGWGTPPPHKGSSINGWEVQEVGPSSNPAQHVHTPGEIPSVVQTTLEGPAPASVPSAPPIDDGPIHYPSIDSTPIDLSCPAVETLPSTEDGKKDDAEASSSCVICLDAPVEGACIPCGHMAGCMSCLNEVKGKKWGCPVCRAKIDQVIRLYAV